MKKMNLLFMAILFAITSLLGQTPEMFKYQAVLRDESGKIIVNTAKTIVVDILKNDLTTSVFSESHNVTTTAQGLINLNIGSVEDLSGIDWSLGDYFIQIAVDGTIMGTSQLLSVPYALNSKTAKNLNGTIKENQIVDLGNYLTIEADPYFEAWDKTSGISITTDQITDYKQEMPNANSGDMSYFDGENWQKVQAGLYGQILTICKGIPTWTTDGVCPPSEIKIGDYTEGGVVFYLLQLGDIGYVEGEQHGFVCDIFDLPDSDWGCMSVDIQSASPLAIGTGVTNTQAIITTCTSYEIAAERCSSLTRNGFLDWFLPSKYELLKLYENKTIVNDRIEAKNGSIVIGNYWTSSQCNTFQNAWAFYFSSYNNSSDIREEAKVYTFKVRAIRAF